MKIKKEYFAVGVALAVIAVIAVAVVLRGRGSSIPDSIDVNPDNIADDIDATDGDQDSVVVSPDAGLSAEVDNTSHEDEVFEWGDLSVPSQSVTDTEQTANVGDQSGGSEFPVVEPVVPEDESSNGITESDLDTSGDTGDADYDSETISLEDYALMMRYYVCGLDTELYNRWLTESMRERFGAWDEEPYKSLHNNKTFGQVVYDESSFSFMAGDGVVYRFAWTFENGKVSSITPL